ncbi:hypothetical protein HID58_041785 [Brassica napus]|uniref:Uncharacterized protein n=1 Tax=Brassica napus TaxID=3708 RepID=A0ABQ8BBT8_BRANA|nr:hypothetical protein HID58_041785 [Brassica napus]
MIINRTDSFEGVVERIRITVNLGILTPVALTYQLPDWMLEPDGPKTPLITLSCDKDVEIMSTVSDYMSEPVLYVTSGPELVAKYQLFCRSPFTIDETTYHEEGVTEEQHRQAIRDLVGGHPIVCSHHILELMFNEPQLLLVYRVALEIEMVYGIPNDNEENEDPAQFLNLTGEEHMSMDEGVTIRPEDPANYDPNIEGMERVNIYAKVFSRTNQLLWMCNLLTYREKARLKSILGWVSAPQPATIIINEDNDGSYTGSSDGVNDNDNVTNAHPPEDMEPFSTVVIGEPSAEVAKQNTSSTDEVVVATDPPVTATNTEPCLDLSLGIGFEKPVLAPLQPSHFDAGRATACRRRVLQLPRRPLFLRISSSLRSRLSFAACRTCSGSKMSSISCFSGGSRLPFPLGSTAQCRQHRTSAGPVPSGVRSMRLPFLLTTFPRLENPLRHPPPIPLQVQLQASASYVCKSGVRGAPHLTRVLDLEACRGLSCLGSPCVSSIITVAGLPTPLAPLSSSTPPPCLLNIASSWLGHQSSQFIRFFDRRGTSPFGLEMDHFHFAVGLTSPTKLQGPHLNLAVSQPTLMWGVGWIGRFD